MAQLGVAEAQPPKACFFPDTYFFAAGSTDVAHPATRARARWTRGSPRRGSSARRDLPLATPYEALILASIVEKETGQRRRPSADRVGVRQPAAHGHAAADRSDGDLRHGRASSTATCASATSRPTRRTTPTRATACRRRRSRCRRRRRSTPCCNPPATRLPVLRRARRRHVGVLGHLAEHNRAVSQIPEGRRDDAGMHADPEPVTPRAGASSRSKASTAPARARTRRGSPRRSRRAATRVVAHARARRHAARRDAARAAAARADDARHRGAAHVRRAARARAST